MIEYYKNKMSKSHGLWQEALGEGKDTVAEKHMADYINYKEMYDGKLSSS